ncbi:tripartite motif-containing protein 16-like protein [Ctenopharyngodon idella]|uniref:tripartite motif-containing protein 16-like protein n=1 Tax=Ctenopharyngodon idella TaxID=7959 RepID=UPI00222EAF70|nr:tripartite motif-containing protein 16-like protein [Ctenopharyngodon idella]
MPSVSEQLLHSLDDLDAEERKRFKWHLKNNYNVPSSALENADRLDTVDLMMARFGPDEAVKITVDILKKMNLNHKAEELEKKHKEDIVPRTRNDFLQYSHQFTLDPNTVNERLRLSESNRVITYIDTVQPYPDHPDRFDVCQVLCRESVCGRCYCEIEWIGTVYISVSYKSISRKGGSIESVFGNNDQSWSLICSSSRYSFIHNNIQTDLPVKPISSRKGLYVDHYRIGVYVDHSAGTLSFYSISDTMSLIHTVRTTFTQPLYPGFGVYCELTGVRNVKYEASVKLC